MLVGPTRGRLHPRPFAAERSARQETDWALIAGVGSGAGLRARFAASEKFANNLPQPIDVSRMEQTAKHLLELT